jgi:hypothetical protein
MNLEYSGLHRSPSHVQGSHHHYALIWVRWFLLRGSAAITGSYQAYLPITIPINVRIPTSSTNSLDELESRITSWKFSIHQRITHPDHPKCRYVHSLSASVLDHTEVNEWSPLHISGAPSETTCRHETPVWSGHTQKERFSNLCIPRHEDAAPFLLGFDGQ